MSIKRPGLASTAELARAIPDALELADALTSQCAIPGQDPGNTFIRIPAFLSLFRAKLGA